MWKLSKQASAFLSIVSISLFLSACAEAVVVGAAGTAVASNDRRTIGTLVEDENIEIKAVKAIFDNDKLWENSDIDITSFNRVILLIGQTPTRSLKQEAEKLVASIPNVKRVYNEIRVAAPTSSLNYFSDITLTTRIKTALFSEDNLDSSQIKVITEDSEVFLMGLVTKQEAAKAIDIARNVSGVKRVIQAFEIIENVE